MPFGHSIHHRAFPGTITLNFETLINVYVEVYKSLLNQGFDKIVIMNGHGGNKDLVFEAIRRVREDTGKIVYAINIGGFGSEVKKKVLEQKTGGHACESETSTALYLGARMLMDKAEKWKFPKNWTDFDKKYFEPRSMVWITPVVKTQYFHEITETGSLGDPTITTKEKGKQMVDAIVQEISLFINDLKFALMDLMSKSYE